MSMEPPLFLPAPKIKEEDDTFNIIDLDKDKTPEDVVYEWDLRVRIKFKNCYELCEQSLDALMKWYIQLIKDEAVNFEDFATLKVAVAKHLQFFKLYFTELNCCFVDNYLDNLEEILTFYSNVEVKTLPKKRRDGNRRAHKKLISSVCRKLISMLYFYLMNREDRICHVLMKVKLDIHSEECKEMLNLLYGRFCTKEPRDKTDLEFCRAYILCQKWKTIRESKEWEKIDEVMYRLYDRTPESLKTNDILKQILYPQNNYVLDMLAHISERHISMTDAYFKFIKSKKSQEDNVIVQEINNIALHDDIPDLVCDDEHEEFNRAYNNFVRTMSAISQETIECVKLEDESDDDELQVVAVTSVGYDSVKSDLIHEFVDDDIEIIYFKKKEEPSTPVAKSSASKEIEVTRSFWESVQNPSNKGTRTEKVTSSNNNGSVLFKPTSADKTVSTSSTSTELVDRSKCNTFTQISSTELEISDAISAEIWNTVSTKATTSGMLTMDTGDDFRTNDSGTSVNMETSTDMKPSPINVIKSVTNIETQTEDFSQVVNASDLNTCQCSKKDIDKYQQHISENHTEQDGICRSYYYYGLVTPPSDQPPDEHSTPPTESSVYPNVYANIVRTHNNPDDTDSIAKVSENDYLPSPSEENDSEEINKIMTTTSEVNRNTALVPVSAVPESPEGQNNVENHCIVQSDEESITDFEEFGGDTDSSAKKVNSNLDNSSDLEDDHSTHSESISAKSVITEPQVGQLRRDNDTLKRPNLNNVYYEHNSNFNDAPHHLSSATESMELISNVVPLPYPAISCRSSPSPKNQTDFTNGVTSGSHNMQGDIKTGDSSSNVQCTSTDFIPSGAYLSPSCNIPPAQVRIKFTNPPCTSPDITSTSSVDIHDFQENLPSQEDEHTVYVNLNVSESDVINLEYIEYSEGHEITGEFTNNENVSQSNLIYSEGEDKIFIEESILMNNEEELFIIGEELPVATNVNISTENDLDELTAPNNIYSPNNANCPEIEEHETVIEANVHNEENEISPLIALEKGDIPNCEHEMNEDVSKSVKKIMFTSTEKVEKTPVDVFERFQGNLHGKWGDLQDSNSLDNILSGPVTKINGVDGCVNPDTSFDLFSSKPSTPSKEHTSKTVVNSSNSSVEVTSPEYEEGIDDFKTYYEQSKNNTTISTSLTQNNSIVSIENSSVPKKNETQCPFSEYKREWVAQSFSKVYKHLEDTPLNTNKSSSDIVPATGNKRDKSSEMKNNVKRTRIAFAENISEECHTVPHSTTDNSNSVLQGILKKPPADSGSLRHSSKRGPRLRIPRRLMNLKSLSHYNVKPNDACLQDAPCVVIERLSESEISQWLRVSEISRKVRLQKRQAQFVATQPVYRLDYDKRSPQICDGDKVFCKSSQGVSTVSLPQTLRNWRSNTNLPSKSSRLDEGMVASTFNINSSNDNDYNNCIPVHCKSSCCNSLTDDLTNLNVSRTSSDIILNLSCTNPSPNVKGLGMCIPPKCNPFLSKMDTNKVKQLQELVSFTKNKHNYCNVANLVESDNSHQSNKDLDLKLNFKCDLISKSNLESNEINYKNESSLTHQPAIVPDVEEFEKTIKIEEMTKASLISSDSYNLDFNKFPQNPVANCFSPPSDSLNHTFLSGKAAIHSEADKVIVNLETQGHNNISNINKIKEDLVNDNLKVDIPKIDNSDLSHPNSPNIFQYNLNDKNLSNFENNNDTSKLDLDKRDLESSNEIQLKILELDWVEDTKSDCFNKVDINAMEIGSETRLPLKKRKHSVANTAEEMEDEDFIGPDLVEEIIKRARAEKVDKDDISYPAKPMISIAEIQEKLSEPHPRVFKTPAERKEMPPPPTQQYLNPLESPRIVTEQYNNHTYNNPTINYHMNNVPYSFFPCASLPYFPPILLPINSTTTFDMNLVTPQQSTQSPSGQEPVIRARRERKTKGRKRNM